MPILTLLPLPPHTFPFTSFPTLAASEPLPIALTHCIAPHSLSSNALHHTIAAPPPLIDNHFTASLQPRLCMHCNAPQDKGVHGYG